MFSRGWVLFLVTTVAAALLGVAYTAWTGSLHVEGQVQTGNVDAVWNGSAVEVEEFVAVAGPGIAQLMLQPLAPELDVTDCSVLPQPGDDPRVATFVVVNAFPNYVCRVALQAIVTASVPVSVSSIQTMASDESGSDVLGIELGMDVALTGVTDDPQGSGNLLCDPDAPLDSGTEFVGDDVFCVTTTLQVLASAAMDQVYTAGVWIDLTQWNLATEPVDTAVSNQPVASLLASPNPASCDSDVTFDAGGSYASAPDRSIVRYEWDFSYDDTFVADLVSATSTERRVMLPPKKVAVRVVDDGDPAGSDVAAVILNLPNEPPVADAGGAYAVEEGGALTLDAEASSDPDAACGDSVSLFNWDLDDDGVFDDAAGATPTVSFGDNGTFTVRLLAIDGLGGVSTDSTSAVVSNVAPVVTAATGLFVGERQAFSINLADFDDPGRDDTHTATINWGDGTSTEPGTLDQARGTVYGSHVYESSGTYVVTIVVTDDDGGTAEGSAQISAISLETAPSPPITDDPTDEPIPPYNKELPSEFFERIIVK